MRRTGEKKKVLLIVLLKYPMVYEFNKNYYETKKKTDNVGLRSLIVSDNIFAKKR